MKTFKQYLTEDFKSVKMLKGGHLTANKRRGVLGVLNTGDKFKDKDGNINAKVGRTTYAIKPTDKSDIFDVVTSEIETATSGRKFTRDWRYTVQVK